jgi:hypothetical protein
MANVKPATVKLKVYLCSWRVTPILHIVTNIGWVGSLSVDGGYVKETEALLASLNLLLAAVGLGKVVLQLLVDGLIEDLDTICLSGVDNVVSDMLQAGYYCELTFLYGKSMYDSS